jgi:tight adherence protein B
MNAIVPVAVTSGLLLLGGAAWTFALAITRRTRHELEHRVNLVAAHSSAPSSLDAIPPIRNSSSATGTWLRHAFSVGVSRRWAMRTNGSALVVAALAGGFATWLLFRGAIHFSYWIAVPAAFGGFCLAPRTILKRQQRRTEQRFVILFPDAVDMVVRMLRAGLPITGAIRAIANEAPAPVDNVFRSIADQMDIGITFEKALADAGETIGLPDFRFFSVAVSLQRATGGNLTATLETLADIVRKRRTVRLQAQAATGEVRMSAYILGALPFLVTGTFLVISPHYLSPLITDPRGNVIVVMACAGLLLAYLTMRRMLHSVTMA